MRSRSRKTHPGLTGCGLARSELARYPANVPAPSANPPADPVLHLRPFRKGDGPRVVQLIGETIEANYRAVYPPAVISYFHTHHALRRVARRARTGYTVVVEEGTGLVATGSLEGAYIGGVFVRPGAQRRGVGRAVMAALEERARAPGVREIHLNVSLPARGFYERLGYGGFTDAVEYVGSGVPLVFWMAKKTLT